MRTNTNIEKSKLSNRRTSPELGLAINEIKVTVKEDGFYSIREYLDLVEERKLSDELLLPALQEAGFGFVKTFAVNKETEQEVIVDLRYVAAAMLLIYADNNFAKNNSVFKYVRLLHAVSTWAAAFPMVALTGLLADIYGSYGHHFSISKMADVADLTNEDEKEIEKFAVRNSHPMHNLSQHDEELTQVFHLCLRTMDAVNNNVDVHANNEDYSPGAVCGYEVYRNMKNPKAYNHFKRAAVKILDKHRKDVRKAK